MCQSYVQITVDLFLRDTVYLRCVLTSKCSKAAEQNRTLFAVLHKDYLIVREALILVLSL